MSAEKRKVENGKGKERTVEETVEVEDEAMLFRRGELDDRPRYSASPP
jgi:hypothetical protein